MNNKKILVVTSFPIPHIGGASTHIQMLIKLLKQHGVYYALVEGNSLKTPLLVKCNRLYKRIIGDPPSEIEYVNNSINMVCNKIRYRLKNISNRVIIHSHDPVATCAAVRSGVNTANIIQTVHGPMSKEVQSSFCYTQNHSFIKYLRSIEDEAFCNAKLLIPVDKGQAEILSKEFHVQQDKMKIIENAIDIEQLQNIVVGQKYSGPCERYFLVPRRLVPKNGVEYAIRGFSEVNNYGTNMLIAGDGVLRKELEALVIELGLTKRVHFLGNVPREQLIPIMKYSLAVIVPSVPHEGVVEATSLSVLEAMSLGTVVIGSSIGGIADILVNRANGYLTNPTKYKEIAEAMNDVLRQDEKERCAIIQNARCRVRERYGIERWGNEIFEAYENINAHS